MAENYDYTIDYNEQMMNYYPEIIKAIREFQVLIKTQSIEVENAHKVLNQILADSYILTADAERLSKWEHLLEITPLPQGEDDLETWLSDRRETILARLYNVEKLNSKSIAEVVSIFTGGTAQSYFKDSTIYVMVTPPKNNKSFKFENVEQELKEKIPAHLKFKVARNYYTWLQVKNTNNTWGDVNNNFATWEEVIYFAPF